MDIKLRGNFMSLSNFEWNDIPRFAVVCGPNGSGKSHLLKLIHAYYSSKNTIKNLDLAITPNFYEQHDIILKNSDWTLQKSQPVSISHIQSKKNKWFDSFRTGTSTQIPVIDYYNRVLKENHKNEFKFWTKDEYYSSLPSNVISKIEQLNLDISEIFFKYRIKEINLLSDGFSKEQVQSRIGKRPWVELEEMLEYSSLPFKITNPEKVKADEEFILEIFHNESGHKIEFNSLSSGESVIFSLFFLLYHYKSPVGNARLLLLDEPDAHLHPQYSKILVNILLEFFVRQNQLNVILTTHSPSTVFFCPDESLFIMNPKGPDRIVKCKSKDSLIDLLSGGSFSLNNNFKLIIVEDKDDVLFFESCYKILVRKSKHAFKNRFVFVPSSGLKGENLTGGKSKVSFAVNFFRTYSNFIKCYGIIDADEHNEESFFVKKIQRYGIENYLVDPIYIFCRICLLKKDFELGIELANPGSLSAINGYGEETLSKINQKIINKITTVYNGEYSSFFKEDEVVIYQSIEGKKINSRSWLHQKKGKHVWKIVEDSFNTNVVRFDYLISCIEFTEFVPKDIEDILINFDLD